MSNIIVVDERVPRVFYFLLKNIFFLQFLHTSGGPGCEESRGETMIRRLSSSHIFPSPPSDSLFILFKPLPRRKRKRGKKRPGSNARPKRRGKVRELSNICSCILSGGWLADLCSPCTLTAKISKDLASLHDFDLDIPIEMDIDVSGL